MSAVSDPAPTTVAPPNSSGRPFRADSGTGSFLRVSGRMGWRPQDWTQANSAQPLAAMQASSRSLRVVQGATIASLAAVSLGSLLYLVGGDATRSARLIVLVVGWVALGIAEVARW